MFVWVPITYFAFSTFYVPKQQMEFFLKSDFLVGFLVNPVVEEFQQYVLILCSSIWEGLVFVAHGVHFVFQFLISAVRGLNQD